MRDYPWHLRLPTTQHYQWFRNLVDLHELTLSWLKEMQNDRPSHLLTRGLNPEVFENLWMLDSLSETPIEKLLDDTSPDDMLSRLEHTIWAAQAWTLTHLYSKTTPTNKGALESVLEQGSWKLGRACADKRWETLTQKGNQELRDILLALHDSPFSAYPRGESFLVKRAVSSEIQIELRACPHHTHHTEAKPVADRLCRLHAQWMRGFAYGLNSRVSLEHVVQTPRCIQRWFFG